MKTWVTQLRKGLLEFCVLNVLRPDEAYGYEIVTRLKAIPEMTVSESTVYPILSRLRADGFLKVRMQPSPSRPPRRYFSLTALGKRRVNSMNSYWDSLTTTINEIRNHEATS